MQIICDVKRGIDPCPLWLGRETNDAQFWSLSKFKFWLKKDKKKRNVFRTGAKIYFREKHILELKKVAGTSFPRVASGTISVRDTFSTRELGNGDTRLDITKFAFNAQWWSFDDKILICAANYNSSRETGAQGAGKWSVRLA